MSRRQRAAVLALIGVVAVVLFSGLFAGVYVGGQSTTGRVVGISHQGSAKRSCFPIIEYTAEGAPQRARTQIGTSPCGFSVGNVVTVYCWPNRPAEPTLLSIGTLLPFVLPLGLSIAAAVTLFGRRKVSDIVAEAAEVNLDAAADGRSVKIRGRLEPAPRGDHLSAPLTGRDCLAYWARVVERKPGAPDANVQDEKRWTDFVVRTARGPARVAASSALKLGVDADQRGESDHASAPALEAFLVRHGHPPEVHETRGHHYVWYEGVFLPSEDVLVVGVVNRHSEPGSVAIVAPQGGHVSLEHVNREERKRAAHRS